MISHLVRADFGFAGSVETNLDFSSEKVIRILILIILMNFFYNHKGNC